MSLLIKRDDKNAKGINKKAVKNATHEEYKNTNDTKNEFPKSKVNPKNGCDDKNRFKNLSEIFFLVNSSILIDSRISQNFFVWPVQLFNWVWYFWLIKKL